MQAFRHFLLALQFFTRIPITGRLATWVGYSPAMLRASAAHFPGVGWLVGAVGAAVLWGVLRLLPGGALAGVVAALLGTIATAWLTGAFHEDGLADSADGLGGGATRERALEIMKDSRIGSYGTVTLVLALALKVALLALIAERGAVGAALTLLVAHVLSRFAPLVVMARLPYVGDSGQSKSKPLADAVSPGALLAALLWCVPALALVVCAWRPVSGAAMLALAAIVIAWWVRLLRRRLGGFTGDTLGAVQQLTELALYLGLAATLG